MPEFPKSESKHIKSEKGGSYTPSPQGLPYGDGSVPTHNDLCHTEISKTGAATMMPMPQAGIHKSPDKVR